MHRWLRSPPPDELLTQIVDQILMPLIQRPLAAPAGQIRRSRQRIARRRRKMQLAIV